MLKNLSVRQKMFAALILCVIVPILLLGVVTTTRVLHLSEENQYEIQRNQLIKTGKDIEKLYDSILQEVASLSGDSSVQAITAGNATVMDYKYAAEKLQKANENMDFCSAVTLSKEGRILFQRGKRYINEWEDERFTSQIEEERMPYLWAAEHPVTFSQGIKIRERSQISYYTTIMKEITLKNEGVLGVHIDTEEFLEQFFPYINDENNNGIFLFDGVGNVLISNADDVQIREKCWEVFSNEDRTEESGYFPLKTEKGTSIVLYTKCGPGGWYLFQAERKVSLYSAQIFFLAGAIVLCIVFGIVYGMIQNKTIIQPLHHLSKRMDAVKKGVLEKKDYEVAHDEIGNVEKGFEDMVAHINKLINEVYMQTIKTQDAERKMLLAKMNPHFLYNSLDSIHWLAIRNKDYEVSEQLEALADVYRYILQFGEDMILVREDMEFIGNYLFLLEFQMGDRIEFIQDIPEELQGFSIPKLVTQPLIENAVQHGLKDKKVGGKVKIRMRKSGEKLKIQVLDNGTGCDAARLNELIRKEVKDAFALRNIDERIRLRYGEEYGIRVYSKEEKGTIVTVTVKLEA